MERHTNALILPSGSGATPRWFFEEIPTATRMDVMGGKSYVDQTSGVARMGAGNVAALGLPRNVAIYVEQLASDSPKRRDEPVALSTTLLGRPTFGSVFVMTANGEPFEADEIDSVFAKAVGLPKYVEFLLTMLAASEGGFEAAYVRFLESVGEHAGSRPDKYGPIRDALVKTHDKLVQHAQSQGIALDQYVASLQHQPAGRGGGGGGGYRGGGGGGGFGYGAGLGLLTGVALTAPLMYGAYGPYYGGGGGGYNRQPQVIYVQGPPPAAPAAVPAAAKPAGSKVDHHHHHGGSVSTHTPPRLDVHERRFF
jgi:hypothetical protein